MNYYAHSNGEDETCWQLLRDHLEGTARIAAEFARPSGLADFAYLAGYLHDLGKFSQAFQKRLRGDSHRVDHATAGARELMTLYQQPPAKRTMAHLLAFTIAGHHGGLPDYGSAVDTLEDSTLNGRLKRNLPPYEAYKDEITIPPLPDRLPISPNLRNIPFSLSFFVRMIYSALVDADFLDTETFMRGGPKPRGVYEDIETLDERFNRFLNIFAGATGPVNRQRAETLRQCIEKAAEPPGLFSLTVPTGGGKTFSSMAFALRHARLHGLRRVIYVIPYTSIIEQNADKFREALGEQVVLEHHSNFDPGSLRKRGDADREDGAPVEAIEKLRLAAENWDIPIVVTTNVQFFESLFASRSSRARKLHNISRSVIIFDEAQMLPREFLQPCLFAVHELVTNYGASAVFCTATQPAVHRFLPDGRAPLEITPDPQELYRFYRRVRVQNEGRLTDEQLADRLNQHRQVLCILNTRRHARGVFDRIQGEGRFHLSTLMYPAHRRRVIAEIRRRLEDRQPCQVVSTQLIEAGVDLDFPVGFRALAGLDSIVQAAGRVNREGKQKEGVLFVFEPDSPLIRRVPAYIRQGAEVARETLRKYPDPTSLEAVQAYFERLYALQDPKAFDAQGILDCFELWRGRTPAFNFRAAAEKFKLIEDNTVPVIVAVEDSAKRLLDQIRSDPYPARYHRALQPYTVNIYQAEFNAMLGAGLLDTYADTFAVLNDESCYDRQTGLRLPESPGGDALFF